MAVASPSSGFPGKKINLLIKMRKLMIPKEYLFLKQVSVWVYIKTLRQFQVIGANNGFLFTTEKSVGLREMTRNGGLLGKTQT